MNAIFVDHPTPDKTHRRIYSPLCGVRFEDVTVRISLETYLDPKFHEWVRESLLCRFWGKPTLRIEIEVAR